MAITKQTAARSTGGKAPRAQLAMKAARLSKAASSSSASDMRPASKIVWVTSGNKARFQVYAKHDGRMEEILDSNAREQIGPEIAHWCKLREGRFLTEEIYDRWSIGDWTAEATKSKRKDFEPFSVKLMPTQYVADSVKDKGNFFPIVFCSLYSQESAEKQARFLDFVDDWCRNNSGKAYILSTLGNNKRGQGDLPPASIRLDIRIRFQSEASGCAPCAVANLIAGLDIAQATVLADAAPQLRCQSLRQLARWMELNTRWTLRRTKEYQNTRAGRLEYILNQTSGMFVVTPSSDEGVGFHVVGVDAFRRQVLDPSEQYVMALCCQSFERSCGEDETFEGFSDYRKVVRKDSPQKKRKPRRS